jgi:hypothetical protein
VKGRTSFLPGPRVSSQSGVSVRITEPAYVTRCICASNSSSPNTTRMNR